LTKNPNENPCHGDFINKRPFLTLRGYRVRYKSAEEGAKPEESYAPYEGEQDTCSFTLEVNRIQYTSIKKRRREKKIGLLSALLWSYEMAYTIEI
jgi:hypothetical protein